MKTVGTVQTVAVAPEPVSVGPEEPKKTEMMIEENKANDLIKRLDYAALGKSTKHAYYKPETLERVEQVYQALIFAVSTKSGQSTAKVNEWLRAQRRIGTESAQGVVVSARLPEGLTDLMVVKTIPSDPTGDPKSGLAKAQLMLNETVITRILTNLRPRLPNFVITFGMFTCAGMAEPKRTGPAPKFCVDSSGAQITPYLMLERVETMPNSTSTFGDLILKCSADPLLRTAGEEFVVEVLMQTMLALNFAQEVYKLVHFDLHPNNILMRGYHELDLQNVVRMPYTTTQDMMVNLTAGLAGHRTRVLPMCSFPVIIDFGMSRLEYTSKAGLARSVVSGRYLKGVPLLNYYVPWQDPFRIIAGSLISYCRASPKSVQPAERFGKLKPLWDWMCRQQYADTKEKIIPERIEELMLVNPKLTLWPEWYERGDSMPADGKLAVVDSATGIELTPRTAFDVMQALYKPANFAPATSKTSWTPAKIFEL